MRTKHYTKTVTVRLEELFLHRLNKAEINMSETARKAWKRELIEHDRQKASLESDGLDTRTAAALFNTHLNFLEDHISEAFKNELRQYNVNRCKLLEIELQKQGVLNLHPQLITFLQGGNSSEQILEEWLK